MRCSRSWAAGGADPRRGLRPRKRARARATEALTRYRDNDHVARMLGKEAFARGIDARRARLADANLDVADARARARLHDLPAAAVLRDTLPGMSIDERRRVVAKVIDVVFVAAGHGAAAQRVTICPAGTAPRALPRPGIKKVFI